MLEELERMSLSEDRKERVGAARLAARHDPAESEAVVLRLLGDPDGAVVEAIVTALLETRREAAIALVLRSLGQDLTPARQDREGLGEAGLLRLDGLLQSELDGVEVRAAIVAVLLESDDRDAIAGALAAIGWLAPGGGFPAPPGALVHVRQLADTADDPVAALARDALAALAAHGEAPRDAPE